MKHCSISFDFRQICINRKLPVLPHFYLCWLKKFTSLVYRGCPPVLVEEIDFTCSSWNVSSTPLWTLPLKMRLGKLVYV
ncbi:hypothetical protein AAZX31_09G115600 [Glycine max]